MLHPFFLNRKQNLLKLVYTGNFGRKARRSILSGGFEGMVLPGLFSIKAIDGWSEKF